MCHKSSGIFSALHLQRPPGCPTANLLVCVSVCVGVSVCLGVFVSVCVLTVGKKPQCISYTALLSRLLIEEFILAMLILPASSTSLAVFLSSPLSISLSYTHTHTYMHKQRQCVDASPGMCQNSTSARSGLGEFSISSVSCSFSGRQNWYYHPLQPGL